MMRYTIVRIGIVIALIYGIGLIFASFTQFVMEKKLLDINSTDTILNITMPKYGKYMDIRLEVNKDITLKGNIIIKENNIIIYKGILDKKYTTSQNPYAFYSVFTEAMNENTLLKERKNYIVEIQLEKIKNPISLKISWLEVGFYTLFDDNIHVEVVVGHR